MLRHLLSLCLSLLSPFLFSFLSSLRRTTTSKQLAKIQQLAVASTDESSNNNQCESQLRPAAHDENNQQPGELHRFLQLWPASSVTAIAAANDDQVVTRPPLVSKLRQTSNAVTKKTKHFDRDGSLQIYPRFKIGKSD
ncbi:hypothetical protein R3W88_011888 [Solanum pinnatisectum]|uniref:Uncharacterized protein n=1 Tax=Solanum pinnatisectum TaxID=50273 RepID=A0AAV9LB27_9SOLN|nr:hypothetical protein R3W88_011888 [Solanum pinnatisectum]